MARADRFGKPAITMSLHRETKRSPALEFLRQFPKHRNTKFVLVCLSAIILSVTAFILWKTLLPEEGGTISSVGVASGMRGPYVSTGFDAWIYFVAISIAAICLWFRISVQAIRAIQRWCLRLRTVKDIAQNAAPSDGNKPSN